MTDLPGSLRTELARILSFDMLSESRRQVSEADGSVKQLWRLQDGKEIESVRMQAKYGNTFCFSTQVGCAFRCSFCITGRMGRLRQLTAGEIVAQVYRLRREIPDQTAFNLVAMGMGEPMDNLDAVLEASEILGDELGMNIAPRRITISTVGVIPGIERLTREKPKFGLALSLNGPPTRFAVS